MNNSYIYSMDPAIIAEYLNSLTEMELIAYNIAKSHLGSLFSLEKSNDFLEWLKRRSVKSPNINGNL